MKRIMLIASIFGFVSLVCAVSNLYAVTYGPEFMINTSTNSNTYPDIAMDANGNSIVVWSSRIDGSYSYDDVFGQRYDSSGLRVGNEFRINTDTQSSQNNPEVGMDSNGNFLVVWVSQEDLSGPSYEDVFGQRYDSSGNKVGGEFRVNTTTALFQYFPSVATSSNGASVAVWQSLTGSAFAIKGQRYDSSGNPQGSEFQVSPISSADHERTKVAMDANGDFVVTWHDYYGVYTQRYDSIGNPLGDRVFTIDRANPSVAMNPDGSFVVVYDGWIEAENWALDIAGQRYDSSGNPIGSEFRVNTSNTGGYFFPDVTVNPKTGEFIIAWTGDKGWGVAGANIYVQQYDSSGNKVGTQYKLNETTFSAEQPYVAVAWDGIFAVYGPDINGDIMGKMGQTDEGPVVPEPATIISALLGLAGFAVKKFRK